MQNTSSNKSDIFKIIGWASYLACSWTWCIGMFLPVLLIRDYGPLSFLIFLIPNIFGASMFAFLLSKPEISGQITEKHKTACIAFSLVTILFHIFYIGWISTFIPNVFIITVIILFLLLYFWLKVFDTNQTFTAFIVWVLSLICFILILNIAPVSLEKINLNLIHNTPSLLYLIPVSIFGFLLCPYLDLTFHNVRQSNTTKDSKISFILGFCFMFLLMMLFTYIYAKPMASVFNGVSLPSLYVYIIFFHMLIQSAFTMTAHAKCVLSKAQRFSKTVLLFLILSIVVYLVPVMFKQNNEIIYILFMVFYSLIFPSYVFMFMIPKKSG